MEMILHARVPPVQYTTSSLLTSRLAKPTRQPKDHPAQPRYWAGLGHLGMTRGPDVTTRLSSYVTCTLVSWVQDSHTLSSLNVFNKQGVLSDDTNQYDQ